MSNEVCNAPRFSIIIPVYNAAKYIGKCLDSIRNQTNRDFEIVLVNDGSTDESLSVVENFKNDNQELNVNIYSHTNHGAGYTRNRGIDESRGDYLVFIDSDDYVEPDYLQSVSDVLDKEDSDVVFIDIVREREDGSVIAYERMSDYHSLSKDRMIRQQLTGKMPWGGCRKIVRGSIVRYDNIRYGTIKTGEESIFSFRVLEKAEKMSFINDVVYHYVDASNSLTSSDKITNPISVFCYIYDYFSENSLLEEYGETINSLAVTTVAIVTNILAQQEKFFFAVKKAKEIRREYTSFLSGRVDKDSLEKRVAICLPWIKMGVLVPIALASRLQRTYKRLGGKK